MDGSTLAIADVASTMMMCEEDIAAAEQALFANLDNVRSFALAGPQLHLFDEAGALLLSAAPAVHVP